MENFASWFSSPEIGTFAGALAVVFLLLALELILLLTGAPGTSDALDALVASESLPDSTYLSWLSRRGMPLSLSIVAVLSTYGVGGLFLQAAAFEVQGAHMPLLWAVPLPLVLSFFAPRALSALLFKMGLLASNTDAQRFNFVGQVAVMHDPAKRGAPGLAYLTDSSGYRHMLRVEPESSAEEFSANEYVEILVQPEIALYLAKRI